MIEVTERFVKNYHARYKGNYPMPKWGRFCIELLKRGYKVQLHPAKTTVSKYIYVTYKDQTVKVRFSNHKPAFQKQIHKDCDYYVGAIYGGAYSKMEEVMSKIILKMEGKRDNES